MSTANLVGGVRHIPGNTKSAAGKVKKRTKWEDEQAHGAPVVGRRGAASSGTGSASSVGLRDFEDPVWDAMGSTSNSTAAIEARTKAGRKARRNRLKVSRSFSKTMFPGETSNDDSSSTEQDSKRASGSVSKCPSALVYPVVAIIVTLVISGVIVAAMERENTNDDEPQRTAPPKKATFLYTECPMCSVDANDTYPAEYDVDDEQPHADTDRPSTRRRQTVAEEAATPERTPDSDDAKIATNVSEAKSHPQSAQYPSSAVTTDAIAEGKRRKRKRRRDGSASTRKRRRVDSTTPTAATSEEKHGSRKTTVENPEFSEWAAVEKGRNVVANSGLTTGGRVDVKKVRSFREALMTTWGGENSAFGADQGAVPTESGAAESRQRPVKVQRGNMSRGQSTILSCSHGIVTNLKVKVHHATSPAVPDANALEVP
ncbi:hypothetical protein HPB52_025313 [Rhipicephalus sanguineus]|uniref:Uncharacterized protein n=1 Tax=Rhipicephalus sanguineus TaxID=34632 RepID=A0A9D4P9T7_RHISA|nr:hypothetical protein HPB52_025313 [Rhipicephalus sanguineus]